MIKTVPLNVQLVGHTVFNPPTDDEENDLWIFTPDASNELGGGLYDGQALVEFAGRVCYGSHHKPNPVTASNAGYIDHILETGHGSVLEHASVSFYLTGISRSLTHELIRHRHFSFSELSQRFVNMADASKVIPPLLEEMWEAEHLDVVKSESYVSDDVEMEKFFAPVTIADALAAKAYSAMVERAMKFLKGKGVTGFPARKQANQMARAVMSNMVETRMVITGNYRAWLGFLTKRHDPAADAEIYRLAEEIRNQLAEHAPNVFGKIPAIHWEDHGTLT